MSDKPINVFQSLILMALNNSRLGKHIYGGTADPVVVAKRRNLCGILGGAWCRGAYHWERCGFITGIVSSGVYTVGLRLFTEIKKKEKNIE